MEKEKAEQHVGLGPNGKKLYRAFGETKCREDWIADPRCAMSYHGLRKRLARGMPFEEAISQLPVGTWTIFGETKAKKEWIADPRCAATESTIDQRIQQGMSLEEALTKPSADWAGPRLAFGEWKTLKEWRRDSRCIVLRSTLLSRLAIGWDLESALSTPGRKMKTRQIRGEVIDKAIPASNKVVLEAFGETLTIVEWARDPRCLITLSRLRQRLRTGWNLEAAIVTPAREIGLIEVFGEMKNLTEWANDPRCLVSHSALQARISAGMAPFEAILTPGPQRSEPWQIKAFGETKTLQGWAKDPRCVVSARGLQSRLLAGETPEEAITHPPKNSGTRRRKRSDGFW